MNASRVGGSRSHSRGIIQIRKFGLSHYIRENRVRPSRKGVSFPSVWAQRDKERPLLSLFKAEAYLVRFGASLFLFFFFSRCLIRENERKGGKISPTVFFCCEGKKKSKHEKGNRKRTVKIEARTHWFPSRDFPLFSIFFTQFLNLEQLCLSDQF